MNEEGQKILLREETKRFERKAERKENAVALFNSNLDY
jgi:hypothetical protein